MNSEKNAIIIQVDLPESVIQNLKVVIDEQIKQSLQANLNAIHAVPPKLTRKEAAKKLRVSLVTLDSYLEQGLITSQRVGRRVLIPEDQIEKYLASSARNRFQDKRSASPAVV